MTALTEIKQVQTNEKTKATSKKDTKEPLVIFLDEFRAKVCVLFNVMRGNSLDKNMQIYALIILYTVK